MTDDEVKVWVKAANDALDVWEADPTDMGKRTTALIAVANAQKALQMSIQSHRERIENTGARHDDE